MRLCPVERTSSLVALVALNLNYLQGERNCALLPPAVALAALVLCQAPPDRLTLLFLHGGTLTTHTHTRW